MPQDEPDVTNFSTSSEHKLPAVSGAQALQDELRRARGISTSLPSLDQSLSQPGILHTSNGIRRGCVTEVFGPPGSGKSTFGMQIAVNALDSCDADLKVIWLSTSSPLMRSRLVDIASSQTEHTDPPSSPPREGSDPQQLDTRFIYKEISSLPHLLVMLMHPTPTFPPADTTTLIIDGLASFLLGVLPRQVRSEDAKNTSLQEHNAKKANSRRLQMIDNLAAALARLAAARHIAIMVLMSATTSMKTGQRAVLKPALSSQGWNAAIHTRITLYRDLYPQQFRTQLTLKEKRGYRLAEVTRLNLKEVLHDPVPFVIEKGGLRELDVCQQSHASARPGPAIEDIAEEQQPLPALETRPSQPLEPTTTYAPLPTASQIYQQEYDVLDYGAKHVTENDPHKDANAVAVPQADATAPTAESEHQDISTPTLHAPKRKAIEIADSEDEDDEDEDLRPPPTLPPMPSSPVAFRTAAGAAIEGGAILDEGPEEMLFEQHERRGKS